MLYRLLDVVGPNIVASKLHSRYGTILTLDAAHATRAGLVGALTEAAGVDTAVAIDLVLMTHGEPDHIVLTPDRPGDEPNEVDVAQLADELRQVPALSNKLRLCYSTACFGASHIPGWLAAGFTAAIGAEGVNANAATELPELLAGWARGDSIAAALHHTDNPTVRALTDGVAARLAGFQHANSKKQLHGDPTSTIDTVPHPAALT